MGYIPRKTFVNKKIVNGAIFSYTPPLRQDMFLQPNIVPVTVKYIFLTGLDIVLIIIIVPADNGSVLPEIIGLKNRHSRLLIKFATHFLDTTVCRE